MDTRGPRPEPRVTPAHTTETGRSSAHQLRNPGFQGDDELKTNVVQLCKTKNIELWTA